MKNNIYENKLLSPIAEGPFKPSWEQIDRINKIPEWFGKAKFGIWAHWGPQAMGRDGDWYARYIYDPNCTHFTWSQYKTHVKNYGHPSKFGYKDILPLWKAEKWNPERLMKLYKRAGARYFMAMGCHHDNFDCYNSKYQEWSSVNIGPKKDIVGVWQEEAKKNDVHFGVSIHSDYSWWWFQSAFCSDLEGGHMGIPYDGAQGLTGKGTWWEDYDLKNLYGINMQNESVIKGDMRGDFWNGMPERLKHPQNKSFLEGFMRKWFDRVKDLIDNYDIDILYFDGAGRDYYPFLVQY